MKHIIDIDAWERRDNYGFFRSFVNSWYSVTTEIDCTEASAAARAAKRSFFLYYLYAVVRSANEVDELRYRTDKEGRVVFHDRVDIISPIAVPGKTFYTVRIPYHEDFERFYAEAYALITNIPEDGDPYGAEKILAGQGDYDVAAVERIALFLRWFLWSARKLECRFNALQQGGIIPGLRYEIKSSCLHSLHGKLDTSPSGHQYHRCFGTEYFYLFE